MDHLPIRVQYACLEPLVDQSQKRAVVNALGKHLEQPLVVEVVEEALDVGFDHIVVVPELQYDGQLVHAYDSPREANAALERYFRFYNGRRPHQALDDRTPDEAYFAVNEMRQAA